MNSKNDVIAPEIARTLDGLFQERVRFAGARVVATDVDPRAVACARENAGRFGVLDVNPEAKLKAVLEISNSLAGALDLASLLPKILDSLFSIFKCADRGCILLKDEGTGQMVPRAMRHRRADKDSTVRLSPS